MVAERFLAPLGIDTGADPASSIVERGPERFEGRKLGTLATDGADAALFTALTAAVTKAGGVFGVIAPKIAGVTLSSGDLVPAKQKIDGGPSVLYDAVALLISADGAAMLAKGKPSKDFVSDAFAGSAITMPSAHTSPSAIGRRPQKVFVPALAPWPSARLGSAPTATLPQASRTGLN